MRDDLVRASTHGLVLVQQGRRLRRIRGSVSASVLSTGLRVEIRVYGQLPGHHATRTHDPSVALRNQAAPVIGRRTSGNVVETTGNGPGGPLGVVIGGSGLRCRRWVLGPAASDAGHPGPHVGGLRPRLPAGVLCVSGAIHMGSRASNTTTMATRPVQPSRELLAEVAHGSVERRTRGCEHPIRLRGSTELVNPVTGEVRSVYASDQEVDGRER